MTNNLNWILINGPAQNELAKIPTCIDLTVTSPPYDAVRDYAGFMDFNMNVFKDIAFHLYRVTKIGGVVVWIVGDQTIKRSETGTSFEQALYFKQLGFKLHDTMIYERSNPPITQNRYEQRFEYMFVFVKGDKGPKTFRGMRVPKAAPEKNPRKKNFHRWSDGSFKEGKTRPDSGTALRGNIWKYGGGSRTSTDRFAYEFHPAVFPEALAADHIYSWSNPGDLILDPFVGSGTTAKMALMMGRKFIGIDTNPDYLALTKKRIELHRQNRTKESCNTNHEYSYSMNP